MALKVDDSGVRSSEPLNLRVGTDLQDTTMTNGDRLRNGVVCIDRQDLAVDQDEVGLLGSCEDWPGAEQQ